MKKRMMILLLAALMLLCTSLAGAEAPATINIAFLKGPTGMGAAPLMAKNAAGETANTYGFTIAGAPDAITAQLITGELDMAALPTNTIATLYEKTDHGVQVLAVNTLGVLYVLEHGDTVSSLEDLSGKTVVSAGRGTTAEAVASHLFGDDVAVDYVSEHAEAVAQAVAGKYDLVLLPEPFVTSLLAQDAGFRMALDLTAQWESVTGTSLPMGGIAVRSAFAEENPEAVATFLSEYAESVAYANENPAEAAALIEEYEIMAAAVAEKAIPRANMVCLTGDAMQEALGSFYAVLLVDNPQLIGGALPDAAFYYAP